MAKKKIPTVYVTKMTRGEVAFHFAPLGFGVHIGPESLGDLDTEGHHTDRDLRRPLAFLQALRLLGSSEDIKRDLEAAYRLEDANARLHEATSKLWSAAEREKTAGSLERLRDRLSDALKRIAVMENQLETYGWRFNPETRKVSRIAGHEGPERIARHKGPDLLREMVWKIYQENYKGKGNTRPVRKGIARILASLNFDPDELDTRGRTDAPIYMAIYNREYRAS